MEDKKSLDKNYFETDTEQAFKMANPGFCPSCGRQIGLMKRCTYCSTLTSVDERIRVKSINMSTIVLFLAAFMYFAIAATYKPQYDIISSLDETRNFQHVRVLAQIKRVSEFNDKYKKRPTLQFELVDKSAKESEEGDSVIKLKAEGEIAIEMKNKNIVPKIGDIVEASASLYAGKGYRTLSLAGAEFLKVVGRSAEDAAVEATVSELLDTPDKYKEKVVTVKKAVILKRAKKFIMEAADPGQQRTIMVFGADPQAYSDNQNVSISGRFLYYDRGERWEIKVSEDDPNAVAIIK